MRSMNEHDGGTTLIKIFFEYVFVVHFGAKLLKKYIIILGEWK